MTGRAGGAEPDERSRGADVLGAALVALAAFRLAHQAVKFLLESEFIDLAYHYFYATMLRRGLDPFDPVQVAAAKLVTPLRFAGGEAVYTPGYFVLFQPLTLLPFRWLAVVWLACSLTIVVVAVLTLVRHAGRPVSAFTIAFASVLVAGYQPLYEDLVLGQNNTLLLGLAVIAWSALGRGRSVPAGVAVGAMAFVKIPFGALVPLLALFGRGRAAVVAAIAWGALFAVGLPQLGADYYRHYLAALGRHTGRVAADVANLSLNGFWHRALGDGTLVTAVYLVTSLALVAGAVLWVRRAAVSPATSLVIAVTLIPLLSPHTEEHHLVVTLLPLLVVALGIQEAGRAVRGLYIAALVLVASRYSWSRFATEPATLGSVLLSAKVVGVFLLLVVLLRLVATTRSCRDAPAGSA